uniref:Protein groucho-like n=1 Tax=Diabrotica virgifera virgifera TaxID=50390 RepID=A0A6P7G552_DIAVI
MGPHPGLPGMGPAGLLGFGAGLAAGVPGAPGGPHPAVAGTAHPMLKPADMHARDPQDLKRPSSTNAEERLNSVSPGDRDKYRSRSPTEVDTVKRRKEDKLGHM